MVFVSTSLFETSSVFWLLILALFSLFLPMSKFLLFICLRSCRSSSANPFLSLVNKCVRKAVFNCSGLRLFTSSTAFATSSLSSDADVSFSCSKDPASSTSLAEAPFSPTSRRLSKANRAVLLFRKVRSRSDNCSITVSFSKSAFFFVSVSANNAVRPSKLLLGSKCSACSVLTVLMYFLSLPNIFAAFDSDTSRARFSSRVSSLVPSSVYSASSCRSTRIFCFSLTAPLRRRKRRSYSAFCCCWEVDKAAISSEWRAAPLIW